MRAHVSSHIQTRIDLIGDATLRCGRVVASDKPRVPDLRLRVNTSLNEVTFAERMNCWVSVRIGAVWAASSHKC